MSREKLPENLWEQVLATLEIELDQSIVATWLNKTRLFETDENRLLIACQDAYATEIIKNRYSDLIQKTVYDLTGKKFRFSFRSQPESTETITKGPLFDQLPSQTTENSQQITAAVNLQTTPRNTNLNPNYTFDNFVVGNSNRVAHAAAMSVVENPGSVYNPLLIYGGTGVGKTHLLHAIGTDLQRKNQNWQITYLTSEKFLNDFIDHIRNTKKMSDFRTMYRSMDVLLMDDVQFLGGNKEGTQEEFYHTFNELHQAGRQIVLASDRDPEEIEGLASRLISRLRGGLMVNIGMPDYETRIAIIITKSAELGMTLDPQMVEFVADLTPDNIREIEGTLLKIKSLALAQDEPITLGLIRSALQDTRSTKRSPSRKITPETILNLVTQTFDTTIKDLCGRRRKKEIVIPRQMAMFLLRNEIGMNLEDIGRILGGRDHTTVMHGCEKISSEIDENHNNYLKSQLRIIRETLYS